jgi:hypothetical protein
MKQAESRRRRSGATGAARRAARDASKSVFAAIIGALSWAILLAAAGAFMAVAMPAQPAQAMGQTSDPRPAHPMSLLATPSSLLHISALPPSPGSLQLPAVAPGNLISNVQNIVNQIIQAQVFFPARTFQDAVEKATKNIFTTQTEQIRGPLIEVVSVYAFTGQAIFGNAALPDFVARLGDLMSQAAVPVWGLSLALLGLAALTRNAVGLGYGTADVAGEASRWFFIALASGNGTAIVNLVHTGFGALTGAVIGIGGMASAAQLVNGFIPTRAAAGILPLVVLVIGVIIGVITIIVLAVTYIARYALLLAVAGLAPLAIACEGIPFTRFVFRDWLSMFLRLELLQVVNAFILVLFANFGTFIVARGGVAGSLMSLVVMLGLSSALIAVNTSVFKQVFGTAIEAAAQVKAAGDQLMQAVGAVAGVALTASTGMPMPQAAAGAAGGVGSSAAGVSGASAMPPTSAWASSSASSTEPYSTSFAGAAGPAAAGSGEGAPSAASGAGAAVHNDSGATRGARSGAAPGAAAGRSSSAHGTDAGSMPTDAMGAPSAGHSNQAADADADAKPGAAGAAGATGRASGAGQAGNSGHADSGGGAMSRLGEYAQAVGRATGNPLLRGFGEGAAAAQHERQDARSARRIVDQQTDMVQRRAEQLARDMGATDADDIGAISSSLLAPASGATPAQARREVQRAHQDNAPLLRSMSRQYGSASRAAAVAGYDSFGEMAVAMAEERMQQVRQPTAAGGDQVGFSADGGSAAGGSANGGSANGGSANGGSANGGSADWAGADGASPGGTGTSRVGNSGAGPIAAGQLASAPASDAPASDAPVSDAPAQPGPVQRWLADPPGVTTPGGQNMTPFDYGAGTTIARTVGANPGNAPLWANTAQSLRQAYGPAYVRSFMERAQAEQFTERAAMTAIDEQVESQPSISSAVRRFWVPDTHD